MSEDKLAAIRVALGLTSETESDHARDNLGGALINIEHAGGRADVVCIATIERVLRQLAEVEGILNA